MSMMSKLGTVCAELDRLNADFWWQALQLRRLSNSMENGTYDPDLKDDALLPAHKHMNGHNK